MFDIQGNYGAGWEVVTTETSWKDARDCARNYRQNEPGIEFRIRPESIAFEVKSNADGPFVLIGEAARIPRRHSGWESVTYHGQRFQLHGGEHVPAFINVANPIKGKQPGQPAIV